MLKSASRWVAAVLLVSNIVVMAGPARAFEPFQPLPESPPIPADNPQSAAKIALGKMLYFDRRLSVNDSLSCNRCHDLARGATDYRPVSTGASGVAGTRSAPTLWNVAYQTVLYWDGRATSLEQALATHLLDTTVMAMPSRDAVVGRIAAIPAYQALFNRSFADHAVSYTNITRALASFIRTLRTPGSAFDAYLGGDQQAMSPAARRGFQTYIESGCAACHFWVNLSGPVPGLAFKMGEGFYELFPNFPGTAEEARYHLSDDPGRYGYTSDPGERRMWRVPVLRNIAITAPYFHNGSVATLDEAVRVMGKTQLGLSLTRQQIDDIVAFLQTLTGEFPALSLPHLP